MNPKRIADLVMFVDVLGLMLIVAGGLFHGLRALGLFRHRMEDERRECA